MAKFPPPPVRTNIVGKGDDSPSYPWEKWFSSVTSFLSAPQIPRGTPASSSAPGVDGALTFDSTFLYGYDVTTKKWKRIAWSSF